MPDKYIEYDGILFCLDEKTGYYMNGTIHKRLHQYVWEKEVCEIPDGFQVHHIDGDKSNNTVDNLCLITEAGQKKLHAILDDIDAVKEKKRQILEKYARPAASEWHKSEAGREWHSEKSIKMYENMEPVSFTCAYCGKEFKALPVGQHKYCSNACRSAARRKRGDDNETRICPICGESFTVNKYSETRFCSKRCMGINRTMINEQKRKAGVPLRTPRNKA
jgi:endogenous inhibitor of DNA gyrase (YacG/DUF329 family)